MLVGKIERERMPQHAAPVVRYVAGFLLALSVER